MTVAVLLTAAVVVVYIVAGMTGALAFVAGCLFDVLLERWHGAR